MQSQGQITDTSALGTTQSGAARWRRRLSLAMLAIAGALLAATYLLISPPPDEDFPGAIPWSPASLLRRLVEAMSLFGSVQTVRGVEIKELAFHLAAMLGLVLLAARSLVSGLMPPDRRSGKGAWFIGQALLVAWVLISLASASWSGDARLSLGQAALYALALAWAVALSWTLESRDVPRLLWAYVVAAALGAALCIWYYHERNSYHRPGFPIGNPGTMAGVTLPAALIVLTMLIGGLWERFVARRAWSGGVLIACAAALVPLVWCMVLTFSRGALIGAVLGLGGMLFLIASARIRRLSLFVCLGAVILGSWSMSSAMQDVAMARGASLRFRLYAWRYAAELWSHRSFSGIGAGNYPRLANAQSIRDQALDPAAFMGDLVEHAHSELFEVFAEIGLIGGVTFVAGYIATLAAAAGLLRSNLSPRRRWLMVGLVAGVIAVLGDALASPGFRLPGVPAVFFTLLGALWAMCRAGSRSRAAPDDSAWARGTRLRRFGVGLAAAGLACAAGGLASANWHGVRAELDSATALRASRFEQAQRHNDAAIPRLLDPVRKILARERAVRCANGLAAGAFYRVQAVRYGKVAAEPDEAWRLESEAFQRVSQAYRIASEFSQWAPTIGRAPALAAEAAEMMAELLRPTDPQAAAKWQTLAWQGWQIQRRQRPYDGVALWSLTRFPLAPGEGLALMREALRTGFADPAWLDFLRSDGARGDLAAVLDGLIGTVRPYTPQSDVDALVLSFAPETYRLRALWRNLSGMPAEAAEDAARAVELYRPLWTRFTELLSVALCERAEYVFRADPHDPDAALDLAREALAALPAIQQHKYDQMARPYRRAIVRYLLAGGRNAEAERLLVELVGDDQESTRGEEVGAYQLLVTMFLRDPPAERPDVEQWIDRLLEIRGDDTLGWAWRAWLAVSDQNADVGAILRAARAAGVSAEDLERIRRSLAEEFPEICDELIEPGDP